VSVTYMDSEGRTIATALAGTAPLSLEALPGGADRELTIDLLSKINSADHAGTLDMISPDNRTRVLNRNYISTSYGPRDFSYEITPYTFTTECHVPDATPKCYNCVVNVTTSVKDECGNEVFPPMDNGTHTQKVGTESIGCS